MPARPADLRANLERRRTLAGYWMPPTAVAFGVSAAILAIDFAYALQTLTGSNVGSWLAVAVEQMLTFWIGIAAHVVSWLVFMAGVWHGYRADPDLPDWAYKFSFRWTLIGNFVPMVNLIRPWFGLAEIDARLRAAASGNNSPVLGEDSRMSLLAVGLGLCSLSMFVINMSDWFDERNWVAGETVRAGLATIVEIAFGVLALLFLREMRRNLGRFRDRIAA